MLRKLTSTYVCVCPSPPTVLLKWNDVEFVSSGPLVGLPTTLIGGGNGGESNKMGGVTTVAALNEREAPEVLLPGGLLRGPPRVYTRTGNGPLVRDFRREVPLPAAVPAGAVGGGSGSCAPGKEGAKMGVWVARD